MLIIGLTGGSGCGKGYVSNMFALRGIRALDTDAVSKQICVKGSQCLAEVVAALGEGVLTAQGDYDRAATGRMVFADAQKLAVLSKITHKHILAHARAWLDAERERGARMAIIDAPVLYESGFDAECDVVVAVVADTGTRVARITARDGIDEDAARLRIARQKDTAFYLAHADYIIENGCDATKEGLMQRVDTVLSALDARCGREA